MTEPRPIHTIIIFPKIQIDTTIAIFLLKEFGEEFFPGIKTALVDFWTALPPNKTAEELEAEGILPIDLGGGTFDHHTSKHEKKTDCAATLVAKHLGVRDRPELKQLLEVALRCDLLGKGTLSEDKLDRAFGLAGLLSAMNRVYRTKPKFILETVMAMIWAHYLEQRKRWVEMPKEWKEMKKDGRGREETWPTKQGNLRVAIYESDNISLAGFLRAYYNCDLVIQRFVSSGHTNVVTRQQNEKSRLDFRSAARELRRAEAVAVGISIDRLTNEQLESAGRVEEIPEWFFDTAANTLQNGGISPGEVPATKLSLNQISEIIKIGLG